MAAIQKLKHIAIFQKLNDDELGLIAQISCEQKATAGTQIFAEGERANHIYVLTEGKVHVMMGKDPALEPVIIDTITKGEIFGWSALVDEHSFTASAVAVSDVHLIVIDGGKLNKLCETDDRMGSLIRKGILTIVSTRVAHLGRKFKELIYSRRRTST